MLYRRHYIYKKLTKSTYHDSITIPMNEQSPIPPITLRNVTSFSRLLADGLPPISTKNNPFDSAGPNVTEFCRESLAILNNIDDFNTTEEHDSTLLLSIVNYQRLRFISEIDIRDLVKLLLSDVFSATKLAHGLFLYHETASRVTSFRYDLFTIRHVNKNVPVGVVIIKEPSFMVTSNSAILDSVYEDIVYLRCLYGVKELFAIVTTYDEWNICWLSDCNQFAASDDEYPHCLDEDCLLFNEILLSKSNPPSGATICGTGTMRYSDTRLVPMLVTVIRKMFHATVHPPCVTLGSCNRICIKVTSQESWECAILPESVQKLSLVPARAVEQQSGDPSVVPEEEECFFLLRDYHGGRDGRVWQACDPRGHLAVIKFTTDPNTIQLECDNWNDIYGDVYEEDPSDEEDNPAQTEEPARTRPLIFITKLVGINALIMPVAFHCVESVLDSRQMFFDVALHNWAFELSAKSGKKNLSGQLPSYVSTDQADVECVVGLRECLDLVANHHDSGIFSPRTVAIAAIEKIAHCHYIHEDIEYRHVALLPVVREEKGGIKVELLPIFIDLSQMTGDVKYKVARERMIEKLDSIQFDRDGVRA